jgi:hypothetical protein
MASFDTTYYGLLRTPTTLNIGTETATFNSYITVISTAEDLPFSYYYLSLARDSRFNSADYPTEFFSDIEADLGITLVAGDTFIARPLDELLTKEQRQVMKLAISAKKRDRDGNARSTLDLTLLPTQFDGNSIINNPNVGGLVVGRPWITTVSDFTFYEAFGTTTAISTTQYVNGNKIYAESSTYDVPSFQPARVVVNDVQVVNTESRGHNLVVLDPYGDVVTGPTQYDTYIDTANVTALAAALTAVASGNIVVLVTYDASAFFGDARPALTTGYGSTNTDTWIAQRRSQIFIGIKL